jgi:hypothetical protein
MAKRKTEALPELKQRTFILKGNLTPINYILRSRHSTNKPLQWFDEESRLNRSMRYASNQTSIFIDEQIGDVSLPPIIFTDGKLIVRKEDQLLQEFLMKHPDNGVVFEEFDPGAIAEVQLNRAEAELDAMMAVRDLDIEDLEAIARAVIKGKVNNLTSKELRRDMLMWAKNNPEKFMSLVNDENLKLRNLAVKAVDLGILKIDQDNRTVRWGKSKEKIVTIPFGENVYSSLAVYFKTDEGLDVMQAIANEI